MDIRGFYANLLQLGSPWIVGKVVSAEDAQRVEVHIYCAEGAEFSMPPV